MPASTDYWINDRSGDPLLVITGEVDAALTKALPRLLREVRDVVGERRVTIVFDRGGWSPKLFSTMITDGFDLLTYRKGRCRRINERRFIRRRAALDGRWVDYLLHDQPVRFLEGKLRLRQVTRFCDSGHQTQVISMGPARHRSRLPHVRALATGELLQVHARRVPARCAIDYQIEPEDPTRTIPNPERRQWKVIQHVREKFSCRACEAITQPPAPSHPIARGRAEPKLLAQVLFAKYALHLPLNRQSAAYAREGVDLDVSTLADWVGAAAATLTPLVEAIRTHVFAADASMPTTPPCRCWRRARRAPDGCGPICAMISRSAGATRQRRRSSTRAIAPASIPSVTSQATAG